MVSESRFHVRDWVPLRNCSPIQSFYLIHNLRKVSSLWSFYGSLTHPFNRISDPRFHGLSPPKKGAKTHRPQAKTCDKSSRREAQRAMLCKGVPLRGRNLKERGWEDGELLGFGDDDFGEKSSWLMNSDLVETFFCEQNSSARD